MNVNEQICRLCLKVAENDFEMIDEITRQLVQALPLRMNLDVSKDPIVCKDCAETLIKWFNFKSACIVTEECKFSMTLDRNDTLETINNAICSFCSNRLSESNFTLLDTLMNDATVADMVQAIIPDMDFNAIKNCIICTSCRRDLERYIMFVENCSNIEEKIIKYCRNENVPSFTQVNLSDVRFFPQYIADSNRTLGIKQEDALEDIDSEIYDYKLVKAEEELDVKDEKLNLNEATYETPLNSQSNIIPLETGMLIRNNVTEVKMYECTICTFQAKWKGNLKTHMLVHKNVTEVEMYKCPRCTYQTKHKKSIKRHTLIHKDVAEIVMYKCPTCPFQAKQKSGLKAHTLFHKRVSEIETFKCAMCTFEAKQKGGLKTHMLVHKDVTEVEMFKCSMCAFQAKQKSNLKTHLLIHKDVAEVEMYKCATCNHETRHKGSLTRHMVIHKDVKELEMYKCSMCDFQTKFKNNLKNHMVIHKNGAEVEMYKCSLCTYETKHKRSLKRHMSYPDRHYTGGSV